MIVSVQCDGTPASDQAPLRGQIDAQQSSIVAGSTFARFDEEGNNIAQAKESDDKIVLGYTFQGLPFMLVVDGFLGCDRKQVFSFIDKHVAPLIDQYAQDLSYSTMTMQEITQQLVDAIRTLRTPYEGKAVDFTMSVAVTYQRDDKRRCAGFGIGDTGIAVKRHDTGVVEQLAVNSSEDVEKDAFDNHCEKTPCNILIAQNSLFDVEVAPGDELVGYTSLLDGMEEAIEECSSRKKRVSVKKINLEDNLFDYLIKQNNAVREKKLAQPNQNLQWWGDDATFGQIFVPDADMQSTLKATHFQELHKKIKLISDEKIKKYATEVFNAAIQLQSDSKTDRAATHRCVELTNKLLSSVPGQERDEIREEYAKIQLNLMKDRQLSSGMLALFVAIEILCVAVMIVGCVAMFTVAPLAGVIAYGTAFAGAFAANSFFNSRNVKDELASGMVMLSATLILSEPESEPESESESESELESDMSTLSYT